MLQAAFCFYSVLEILKIGVLFWKCTWKGQNRGIFESKFVLVFM